MIKPMIGVGVFGKQDMISWLLDGITQCFPPDSEVVFFFEACTDASMINFLTLAPSRLKDYIWSCSASEFHILEHGVHCWMIDRFMESDCDVLVIPHDDNKFLNPYVLDHIEKLMDKYGDRLGWIGGRDGYDASYANMISSPFSASNIARAKIGIGEHAERSQLNTGPMVYTRQLITKIGKPDLGYEGWYWWDDYSLKSKHHGLQNILLGMDCLHEKFGQVQNNHGLFNGDLVARDLKKLITKWQPILGYSPI
jgi:hypothetical protein